MKYIKEKRKIDFSDHNEKEKEKIQKILTAKEFSFEKKHMVYMPMYIGDNVSSTMWKRLTDEGYKIDNIATICNDIDFSYEEFKKWCLSGVVHKFPPRDYQIKASFYAMKYHISRAELATSAGKTLITYLLARFMYEKKGFKTLVIVPNKMLCDQLRKDYYGDFQNGKTPMKVKIFYSGVKKQEEDKDYNVGVSCIGSIVKKKKDFFDQFDIIVYDEAHKLSTNQYVSVAKRMLKDNKFVQYGISGTFDKADSINGMKQEILCGPILLKKTVADLSKFNSVCPLKIKVVKLMHNSKATSYYPMLVDFENKLSQSRDERLFINKSKLREKFLIERLSKIDTNVVLLFKDVNYVDALTERLREHFGDSKKVDNIHGSIDIKTRNAITRDTEKRDNCIIVATYETLSTGVSIKRLTDIFLMDSVKSFKTVRQSIGRVLRLHPSKKLAVVHDFVDSFENLSKTTKFSKTVSQKQFDERKKIYIEQKFDFSIEKYAL